MTTGQSWVKFVGERYSDADISRMTGIPRSTVGFVHRGERTLPTEYLKSMRNLYQRTAYRAMREGGASTEIAHKFSWYSAGRVNQVDKIYDELTSKTAFGVTLKRKLEAEDEGYTFDFKEEYDSVLEQIKENYRRSKKDWQDIANYVATKILGEEGFEWEIE